LHIAAANQFGSGGFSGGGQMNNQAAQAIQQGKFAGELLKGPCNSLFRCTRPYCVRNIGERQTSFFRWPPVGNRLKTSYTNFAGRPRFAQLFYSTFMWQKGQVRLSVHVDARHYEEKGEFRFIDEGESDFA
jgi:hypothetical protein